MKIRNAEGVHEARELGICVVCDLTDVVGHAQKRQTEYGEGRTRLNGCVVEQQTNRARRFAQG